MNISTSWKKVLIDNNKRLRIDEREGPMNTQTRPDDDVKATAKPESVQQTRLQAPSREKIVGKIGSIPTVQRPNPHYPNPQRQADVKRHLQSSLPGQISATRRVVLIEDEEDGPPIFVPSSKERGAELHRRLYQNTNTRRCDPAGIKGLKNTSFYDPKNSKKIVKKEPSSTNQKPPPPPTDITSRIRQNRSPTNKIIYEGKPLSEEQQRLFDRIVAGESMFFTGSAGSGKSFVLKSVIRHLRSTLGWDSVAVTASTGIAAHNIYGISLHAFAGIALGQDSVNRCVAMVKRNPQTFKRWKKVSILIVDEISMVEGVYFDKLNYIAKRIRGNEEPFGGIQIVLCGDFLQLPPVQKGSKFVFESETWKDVNPSTYQLSTVFRQKDAQLLKALNEIRNANVSDETDAYIKSFSAPIKHERKPTCLFPRREDVENMNLAELNHLLKNQAPTQYKANDVIPLGSRVNQLNDALLAPEVLTLCRGAQVMVIKNLPQKKLFNGQVGIIKTLEPETVFVSFNDGEPVPISRETFTVDNGKVENPSRTQFPLVLSYAMSIHKSQGQSLTSVKVDLKKVFEKGQTYVALSRCTSTQGLQILNFDRNSLRIDERVALFQKNLRRI